MEYLRTHPLNSTRVAEAQNRIQPVDRKLPTDNLDFQLTRARIIVTSSTSLTELINHIEKLEANKQTLTNQYIHAIALLKQGNTQKAIKHLKQLIRTHDHPWFKLDLAKAYESSQQPEKALQVLQQLSLLYPNYLPVSIQHALILNQLQQQDKAIRILKKQAQKNSIPLFFRFWRNPII